MLPPKIVFIIALSFFALHSHSQFIRADYKKAALIYHRPVVVPIYDLADAVDACDSTQMTWFNETMRELMPVYWKLNDSVIFMEKRMLASIIGSRSPEYVVFSAGKTREGQQSSNDIYWYDSFTFMLFLSEDGRRLDHDMVDRNSPIIPDTETGGQLLRGRYIFKLSFADMRLSKSDIIFAIRQFNERVNLALEKKYSKKGLYAPKISREVTARLQEKTLLLPYDLDPDGTDRKTIEQYYKHPFRLAGQEEIEAARTTEEENTAFLHYIWSDNERMFLGTIIDTHTGELLALLKPNAVKLEHVNCVPAGDSYRMLIRMKAKKLASLSNMIR
jgi:hypothetical protein